MQRSHWLIALVTAAFVGGSSFAFAADKKKASEAKPAVAAVEEKKADKADKSEKSGKAKPIKLTKPWNTISSLTDEQKVKIDAIHKKSVEEQKAIREKEEQDILAVLDDKQKAEVAAATEKETAEKKMKKTGDAKKGG
jgi:hypothetical protein